MEKFQPMVTGPSSKYEGAYKLNSSPENLLQHNFVSWKIIEAILTAYGTADFWDLSVAVRGHKHGTKSARGPQDFVKYCIKNGWIERV